MIISYILELVQTGGTAFDQLGGSRGGAPGSYRFLEHLEVFEEVLEDKMSEFLRSKM